MVGAAPRAGLGRAEDDSSVWDVPAAPAALLAQLRTPNRIACCRLQNDGNGSVRLGQKGAGCDCGLNRSRTAAGFPGVG